MVMEGQLAAIAATLAFGTFDYFGFNLMKVRALRLYRVIQGFVQVFLSACLAAGPGWASAAAFNVIWWTGGADAVYYLWAEGSDGFGMPGWTGKRSTKTVLREGAKWFEWTPVGIVQRAGREKGLPADTLVLQLIVGIVVGMLVAGP
jgi:hypothetical protein